VRRWRRGQRKSLGALVLIETAFTGGPAEDEIEVTLFGPGIGECVLVHLGRGDWIIVDSCLDENFDPVALSYLESLEVAPESVRTIVATHWHNDHVTGLNSVIDACPNAQVYISSALAAQEFFAFAEDQAKVEISGRSAVHELRQVVARWEAGTLDVETAGANRRLWQRGEPLEAEIWAVSPSSESHRRMLAAFADAVTSDAEYATSAVNLDEQNEVSVALWISVGGCRILLGADLEASESRRLGWSAVVRLDPPPWDAKAEVFKVPHHGSDDADDEQVWGELLTAQPFALVTPFYSGRRFRPDDADRVRLRARTPHAYITAKEPARKRKRGRRREVERVTRNRTSRPLIMISPGRIRLRSEAAAPAWKVELSGAAGRL